LKNTTTSACGKELEVPTTIIYNNPSSGHEIYYIPNLTFKCEDATIPLKSWAAVIADPNKQNLILHAYPNPTQNYLHIDMQLPENVDITLNLINSNGQNVCNRILKKKRVMSEQLSISHLPKGLYFIQIITPIGIASQKIMIE